MLSQNIIKTLNNIALKFINQVFPLKQTTSLIIKGQKKFDRVDTKLIKQADKLSKKERLGQIKIQYRERQRVGAITYRSYTIEFKKKLIASIRQELHTTGQTLSKIIRNRAKATKIHPKNITRWYHTKQLKKKEGGRRALYPEMQIRLANFILSNPKMKRKHILRQAKQIMQDLQIPGRDTFNFSKGWYERFRERLSKKKVAKGTKLEGVKLQAKDEQLVKYEYKQQGQQQEDNEYLVKKQQQCQQYDQMDFQQVEDQFDSQDNIKFQENLSDSDEKNNSFFNVKLEDLTDQQQQSIQEKKEQVDQLVFFDEEEQGSHNVDDSTQLLIKLQKSKICRKVK